MSILDAIAAAERSAQAAAATEFAASFETDQFTGPSQGGSTGEDGNSSKSKQSKKDKKAKSRQEIYMTDAAPELFAEAPATSMPAAEPVKDAEPIRASEIAAGEEAEEERYYPYGLDLFGTHHYEAEPQKAGRENGRTSLFEGIHINTSLDEAVDKFFTFSGKNWAKVLFVCGWIKEKTGIFLEEKVQPRTSAGMAVIGRKLAPLFEKAEARLELRRRTAAVLAVLAMRERAVSGKAARLIELIDRINTALIRLLCTVRDKACHRADAIRDYAERHKKALLIEFGIAVAAAAAITIVIGNMTAYEYIYNGKVLGVVKNQEDVYKTVDIIGDK
jgi:hypothetical protein